MTTTTFAGHRNVPTQHVGSAGHPRRNAAITIGLITMLVVATASHLYWRHHDAGAEARFSRFQSAYARCDATAYPADATALAKKLYLKSSTLQRAVEQQLVALDGGAPCDAVYRSLRAVDFPLLSSTPPPARSATIDVPSVP